MSWTWKITIIGTKPRTQQGNASLSLIQDKKNTKTQNKNKVYAKRWFKQNFIIITYENKGYDKKAYPKLVLNKLKVMKGFTFIYIPLRT